MNELRQRRRVSIGDFGEGMTEQSHKKSCDINTILRRFQKTGMLTHVNNMQGKYEDYPSSIDFQQMQNIIASAKSMFESIPSSVRTRFHNDPAEFLEFAQDPANRSEMLEMGFSEEHLPDIPEPVTPVEPEVPPVEPVAEPAPEPPAEPPV